MTAVTKTRRALPERYRQARSVDEGYEIRVFCKAGDAHWVPVVRTLHIHAPLAIVRLELDWSGVDCADGDVVVQRPGDMLYSRRPAVSG